MAQNQMVPYNNNNNQGSGFIGRAVGTGVAAGLISAAQNLYSRIGPGRGAKVNVKYPFRNPSSNAWRRYAKYKGDSRHSWKVYRSWRKPFSSFSYLQFLRSRRYSRNRRRYRRYRRWARNKATRRRLGVSALANRPLNDVQNKVKYRSSLTQNFPPASLIFYPTAYGRQFDAADSSGHTVPVMVSNGWYRFDFAVCNFPPYWYNTGGDLQNRYLPIPLVSCVYYAPNQWFSLEGTAKSDGKLFSYYMDKPPPGKDVMDVMYKYRFCKLRRLRVGIEICHGYKNELLTSIPLINDTAPVGNSIATFGSSSQKCKLYCTHFQQDFSLQNLSGLLGEGKIESELVKIYTYPHDLLALNARPKDADDNPCLLPSADMIKMSPYIYSSGSIMRRRSLKFSPKLRRLKFTALAKQFKPFYGNNIKTLGPENETDYSFPDAVTSDVYHYTVMYIPGETSYTGICNPSALDAVVPSQLPNGSGSTSCKEVPYKATPTNLGWPDLNIADATRQAPASMFATDPALKFHVYYELVFWGPRSGNIATDSATVVSMKDGVISDIQTETE